MPSLTLPSWPADRPLRAWQQEAAAAVHREAHGLVADEIIEVKEGS